MKIITAAVLAAALPAAALAEGEAEFGAALGAARAAAIAEIKAHPLSGRAAVVRDFTTTVNVAVDASTVKCSIRGYSMPQLKILVPALAELTVLNHRNPGEGAPCITAGDCRERAPEDILRGGAGVDRVAVRVVLTKEAEVRGETCAVALNESVSATIRGVLFTHEKRWEVEERDPADCR